MDINMDEPTLRIVFQSLDEDGGGGVELKELQDFVLKYLSGNGPKDVDLRYFQASSANAGGIDVGPV